MDESRIRAAFRSEGVTRDRIPAGLNDRFLVELDKPIVVEGDAMITADWHIPLYDPSYVNTMLDTAEKAGLRTLIIGGDYFNMDALSMYEPKQDTAGLEKEIQESLDVMRVVLQNFDRVVYIWGNHDSRLHKALGMKLQFKRAMKLVFDTLESDQAAKIEFSNLDFCWLESNGERYYICHPASYSRVPLATPRVLAAKHNASVITAHAHHCAVGFATNGEDVIAEIGGLFDRHKTAYLQRSTTFPNWTQGFAYTEEGKLRVHSPKWGLIG